jgi:thiol-disulfide isomerase/thioredoxin
MKLRFEIICGCCFLLLCLSGLAFGAEDAGKAAYDKLKEADTLQNRELDKALDVYLEAVDLYEKAMAADPTNRAYKTNFKYCLGSRGYLQIGHAQELLKKNNLAGAAKYFSGAVTAYDLALTKLPDEKGFANNRDYAKRNGAKAVFDDLLASGGQAPDLDLTAFDGKRFKLSEMKGDVVLLEFWAAWCPSSRESLPVLQQIHAQYGGKGLRVVTVAMDKTKSWSRSGSDKKAAGLSAAHSFTFLWGDEQAERAYGYFDSIPRMFLIDRKGNLSAKVHYEDKGEKAVSRLAEMLLK